MKNEISVIITLFICSACNNSKQDNPISPVNTSNMPYSYLIGKWIICSENGNGASIQYNVCPEMAFNINGLAFSSTGDRVYETMRWKVIKDTLFLTHLSFSNNTSSGHFPDYKYLMMKTEDSSSINLRLWQIEKKSSSNLSRQKIKGN